MIYIEAPSRGPHQQALRNSCELLRQRKELHTSSWNCIQAYGTACKLLELYASLWNSIQAYGTAFKLMELHASLWNCMQAYGTACKLMELL